MTKIHKGLAMSVLCLFLAGLSGPLWAQNPPEETAGEVILLLKEQNRKLSEDLRRIHREIAALRADLDEPGMKEVFAGIGYIAGLFGVAAFVAARRRRQ
jgi:nickel transport protein